MDSLRHIMRGNSITCLEWLGYLCRYYGLLVTFLVWSVQASRGERLGSLFNWIIIFLNHSIEVSSQQRSVEGLKNIKNHENSEKSGMD